MSWSRTRDAHTQHARYMRMALRLADRGAGRTSPNPMVGAVIVNGGRVVGTGYHRAAGLPHAEPQAIRRAGARARGGTLYVNLEPCNHVGKTPPCCDAILQAGLATVIIGAKDPNPLVNGRGIARLRHAGVRVITGVLAEEARRLNEPFWTAMTLKRPLVVAKLALSLDGKIAAVGGRSRWISSPESQHTVHVWRTRVDAIMVGIETVLHDDPRLTVRCLDHRPNRPLRIIVDSRLRIPPDARCLRTGPPTLIATTVRDPAAHKRLARPGVSVLALPARQGRVPLAKLLQLLVPRGIQSVLLEGGGELVAGALAERVVDRVLWFIAPILLGGRKAPSAVGGAGVRRVSDAIRLQDVQFTDVGPDLCVEARVAYPRDR